MSYIFLAGIVIVLFVGFNIGGSTIGPAYGPAIGARAISKISAACLMAFFFFLGAWTIGWRVVDTLGKDLLKTSEIFTLQSSLLVLFFIGLALFCGNYFGVPASTSMTAVGSISGLGLATQSLNWATLGEIIIWWLVSPAIGFWVSIVCGRYFYSFLNRLISIKRSEGPLFEFHWHVGIPFPSKHPKTNLGEIIGVFTVVTIGCLMAFSSGTSNIANAIAPLVGSGDLGMNKGIILGCLAVALGSLTIGRRTLETLGNDLTELPLTAAIVVATVSATIIIILSAMGIPASFVVVATTCIIGLGWGRATRPMSASEAFSGEKSGEISVDALTLEESGERLPEIGEEELERVAESAQLFEPGTTARVILLQNFVPILATLVSYLTFRYLPVI